MTGIHHLVVGIPVTIDIDFTVHQDCFGVGTGYCHIRTGSESLCRWIIDVGLLALADTIFRRESAAHHHAAVAECHGESTVVGIADADVLPRAVLINLGCGGKLKVSGVAAHYHETVTRWEYLVPYTRCLHVGDFLVFQCCRGSLFIRRDRYARLHGYDLVENGLRIGDALSALLVHVNALSLRLQGSGSQNGRRQGLENSISFCYFDGYTV